MLLHNSQIRITEVREAQWPTDSTVRLALDITDKNLKVESVKVYTWQETLGASYKKMEPSAWDENHYIVDLQMPEEGCLVWYYFIVRLEDESLLYYGNSQEQMGGEGKVEKDCADVVSDNCYKADAVTPDWFKKAVMYQIFPDRFYRSGNEIPQKPYAVFHCDWNDPPMYYVDPDTRQVIAYDFFGGNFKGIQEKLGYLQNLGISVIYSIRYFYPVPIIITIRPIISDGPDARDKRGFCRALPGGSGYGHKNYLGRRVQPHGQRQYLFHRYGNYSESAHISREFAVL